MGQYAAKTDVSVSKSKDEIERVLRRYGADGFMYGTQGNQAMLQFTAHGRLVRLAFSLPDEGDFATTPSGRVRKDSAAQEREWEQACRQRWRAIKIWVQAKLEAVESGFVSFEDEWLAHTIVPGTGKTVAEQIGQDLSDAIESGRAPQLLLGSGRR